MNELSDSSVSFSVCICVHQFKFLHGYLMQTESWHVHSWALVRSGWKIILNDCFTQYLCLLFVCSLDFCTISSNHFSIFYAEHYWCGIVSACGEFTKSITYEIPWWLRLCLQSPSSYIKFYVKFQASSMLVHRVQLPGFAKN